MFISVRLPFPTRIPYKGASAFAGLLLIVQLLEGTNPLFALCCLAFIMMSTATFNLAGGFSRPSGGYVFSYSVLAVIIGLCSKAILGEAADSNLLVPMRTILVFLAGIAAMFGAVFVSRKLTPKKGLLQNMVTDKNMQNATVGCMITGLALSVLLVVLPRTSGSILSALSQVNRFLPMAIILGTIYQIRKSGGTSSINIPVLLSGAGIFGIGLLGFSKEGIFAPFACWVIAASSQRYRLSVLQIIGVGTLFVLMSVYLVPYSQYGRSYEGNPSSTPLENATYLLSHLSEVREEYRSQNQDTLTEKHSYFKSDVGFLDRLQMISVDDELIEVTERNGAFGLLPIYMSFGNLVPHFIWPDKPELVGGNTYAHEIGGLSEDDTTTGISFSPSGEGYHLARWYGVLLVAPVLWIMLFTLFDWMCGDAQTAPWGLLAIVIFAHQAPEGMLEGVVYCMGYIAFGIIVAALSAAYFMPIVGSLIKGPERVALQPGGGVRSIPRRRQSFAAPESRQ